MALHRALAAMAASRSLKEYGVFGRCVCLQPGLLIGHMLLSESNPAEVNVVPFFAGRGLEQQPSGGHCIAAAPRHQPLSPPSASQQKARKWAWPLLLAQTR